MRKYTVYVFMYKLDSGLELLRDRHLSTFHKQKEKSFITELGYLDFSLHNRSCFICESTQCMFLCIFTSIVRWNIHDMFL